MLAGGIVAVRVRVRQVRHTAGGCEAIGGYNRAMARKKVWWPPTLYEARPRLALVVGALAGVGGMGWSLYVGHWTAITTLLIGSGAALCIYSAVILQMRREYRERSKWARKRGAAEP
jgi:hypothetical protein